MAQIKFGQLSIDLYKKGSEELYQDICVKAIEMGLKKPHLSEISREETSSKKIKSLLPFYSEAILECAKNKSNVVVLDADLVLDTGLIPFRKKFPNRFFECGIAEQDMVSIASALALKGYLPIVHSFACFLSSRPNEQIF